MMKQSIRTATALICLLTAMPAMAQDAPTRDSVVATVDGTDITLGQMIVAAAQLPEQYQQLDAPVLFQGVLDQLIQQQVLANMLETVPATVTVTLENNKRTLMASTVVTTIADAAATEEAIQAAYDAQYALAEPGIEYNAAHILVATEDEAKAVIDRINAGEDFAAVAQEVSVDTGSGAAGGDLGWFGLGMMVPEFEVAVVALADGQLGVLSAPVQTQFGWHVIKLTETRPVTPPALDEVRQDLDGQIRQAAVEAKLTELMTAAEITRPEEGAFDPALIMNIDLIRD
jgi:peptidyl-prolyl cis-trans isomerase C